MSVVDGDVALQGITRAEIFFDAGTRQGNPGPSAVAACSRVSDGHFDYYLKTTEFVGVKTSNESEWLALIKALRMAIEYLPDLRELAILSDSKLVVKQARGEWRVRGNLKTLHAQALELAGQLVDRGAKITIGHVPREQNSEADRLVTDLLDHELGRRRGY